MPAPRARACASILIQGSNKRLLLLNPTQTSQLASSRGGLEATLGDYIGPKIIIEK